MRRPFRAVPALLALVAGCTDAKDFLRPYAPSEAEVDALVSRPPPAAQYDAALVLGCPADYDGTPSVCERCRIDAALEVWRRSLAGTLVFSGGAAHSPYVEADVMADAVIAEGVPADHVLREDHALTTWQNIRFAQRILDAHGLKTVLVVSTAGHLPRARRIALFYGLEDARTGYLACDRPFPGPPTPSLQSSARQEPVRVIARREAGSSRRPQ